MTKTSGSERSVPVGWNDTLVESSALYCEHAVPATWLGTTADNVAQVA